MYSYEQKKRAIEVYYQYGKNYKAMFRELGYPCRNAFKKWLLELQQEGDVRRKYYASKVYTEEQKSIAIVHFLNNGENVCKAARELGYPSRELLTKWLKEYVPAYRKRCERHAYLLQSTSKEKEYAVIEMCSGDETIKAIAQKHGVNPTTLYEWKKQFFGEGKEYSMRNSKNHETSDTIEELREERERLKKEIYQLQLEKDVLERAAEIIKKDQGITLQTLTNREKAMVIDTLRHKYKLKELLSVFHMAKSSYCYQEKTIHAPDKYDEIRQFIRASFKKSNNIYGYRRIHADIKNKGIKISEKIIRRLMQEENLKVKTIKRKKYSSYMGEISPSVENHIKRKFHASEPNQKWLTDITEFRIPAGKIYLSPIIDCFDGLPVAWTIGTHPNEKLVNTMLDNAIATLKEGEHPIIHSDRGCHYRWPGWIERTKNAGLVRSMSKKGCSPDNSACEGFFGRLKNEMFYGRSWNNVPISSFIKILDNYIRWYAEERIKVSLGGMSPTQYRKKLGLIQ